MKVKITHPDKIMFPKSNITKQDMIDYYAKIAPHFLPLVKNHLMVMLRYPNGIAEEGFFHKEVPDYFPVWLKRAPIKLKSGDIQTLVLVNKKDDLVYLANQGVLVFHAWLSTYKKPNYPDKIVFDLDPTRKDDLKNLRFGAKKLKTMLEKYGLTTFVMTTGSRGYHIVAPIKPKHTFDKVHDFAKNIAQELADNYPKLFTTNPLKKKRKGRILVDYMRNSFGATSVAPYSLRPIEKAPIATPLSWQELNSTEPQKYNMSNIFTRLSRKKDPWKDFWSAAAHLKI